MIKSIKINLFEKNRKEVFNKISVEDKKRNIFINDSNKHLNGNIIDEYIKLLAKPPQLELGLSPHNATATLEALTTYENFNIYENNKNTIFGIDDIDLITFLTIDGTMEDLNRFIITAKNNVTKFLKNPQESNYKRPKPRDFYDLVKRINTKLREINEKLKKNNNYFVGREDDAQKIKDQKKIEKEIYNRIQDQDKHISRDIRNIKNPQEIFINQKIVGDLFDKLDKKLLYDKSRQDIYDRERDSILKQYWKYCFPDKKFDLSTFITEEQKKKVITFYNIYFILKNYYLIDTTKITYTISDNSDIEEYLIKNFDLLDLNNKDLTNSNIDLTKVINIKKDIIEVTFQCVLNRLFNIPNLKINFNFHNIENGKPKKDKTIIFNKQLLPKMIDPSFNNYDKYYIDLSNNINYKTSQENYKKILLKVNKKQKRETNLLNKNDFFFNQTLTNSFIKENENTVKDDKDKKDKDNKKRFENIYYLLINHFNLLNKKIFINNDYYLIEEIFLLEDNKIEGEDDKKKNKGIFINVFNNKRESFYINNTINFSNDISYIDIDKSVKADKKEPAIHSIYLFFYVYKLKDKNETISLKRRVITEGCLDKASKLDSYFKDSLYKALQLNDEYLSNRLKQRGGIRVITKKYRNKRKRMTKKKKKYKKK